MQHCEPRAVPTGPATHSAYVAHCAKVGAEQQTIPCYVQVRRKGAVLCARVLDLQRFAVQHQGTSGEWFKVYLRDLRETGWVPASNVRLCSGVDSGCSCEFDDPAPGELEAVVALEVRR